MLSLTRNDLRLAVVSTLEKRPNNSCKKEDLPNLVCCQLNIQIRRHARKELKKEIKRIISALERAEIIKEYTVKNIRYRLGPEYKKLLSRLLNRGSGNEVCFNFGASTNNSDADVDRTPEGLKLPNEPPIRLPPLGPIGPPPFDPDETEGDKNISPDSGVESGAIDMRLLGVMTRAGRPTIDESEANTSNIKIDDINGKIISLIKLFVADQPELSCEVTINKVRVTLTIDGEKILILILYTRRTGLVDFKAIIPNLTLTPENILKETAGDRFSCIPGLTTESGKMKFQLRRTVPITSEPERCIPDTLDEVINDVASLLNLAKVETI